MAAIRPRITRIATTNVQQQARQLHMTNSGNFPTPLLTSDRPAVGGLPQELTTQRTEWAKRPAEGSKAELARMSYLVSPSTNTRTFNTSRSRKAVNDSSTMDFAFLPDFDPDSASSPAPVKIPTVESIPTKTGGVAATEVIDEAPILRHEIVTPTASAAHLQPSTTLFSINPADVTESPAHGDSEIDISAVASRVAAAAKRQLTPGDEATTTARKVWDGFLDDVFGSEKKLNGA